MANCFCMIIGYSNGFFDGPVTQIRKSRFAPYSIPSSCNWTRWRDAWIYSFQFSRTGNLVVEALVAKCQMFFPLQWSFLYFQFISTLYFYKLHKDSYVDLSSMFPDSIRTSQYYKLPTEVPSWWGWSFWYNSSMFGDIHKKLRRLLCHHIYIGGWRQVCLLNTFWFQAPLW